MGRHQIVDIFPRRVRSDSRSCFAAHSSIINQAVRIRRVFVSPSTFAPTHEWSRRQATYFLVQAVSLGFAAPEFLIRDGDGKFGVPFNTVLKAAGCTPRRIKRGVPVLTAFAERWVRSLKHECLNHFVCFGLKHLEPIVSEYVEHYHEERPHQGLDNKLVARAPPPPTHGLVTRRTRLGGVLISYKRRVA